MTKPQRVERVEDNGMEMPLNCLEDKDIIYAWKPHGVGLRIILPWLLHDGRVSRKSDDISTACSLPMQLQVESMEALPSTRFVPPPMTFDNEMLLCRTGNGCEGETVITEHGRCYKG
jgi:hypothetical protein